MSTSDLRQLLKNPEDLSVRQRDADGTVMIEFGSSYSDPCPRSDEKDAAILAALGATRLDWDEVREGGCESCDHGSRYGATVTIFGCSGRVESDDETKVTDLR